MIELKQINKIYHTGKISFHALHDVSLKIEQGEFVAIMGPSGSGKSTLLHLLGFLDKPDSGGYTIFGKTISSLKETELARLRTHLAGFVFQQFHLLPRTSAFDNVHLPLIYSSLGPGQRVGQMDNEKVRQRLKEVGLAHREANKPSEMSGGEQQRVAIARALVNDPLIIFADEPTGNLDTKSEEEIIKILEALNRQGKTIIMVTHEKEIAAHAQRIIFMRDGRIVSDERQVQTGVVSQKTIADSAGERQRIERILHSGPATMGAGFREHLGQAVRAILSHKVRTLLSMLGILIGVAAVIAMQALGSGAKISLEKRLASLGSNLLMIHASSASVGGVALEAGSVTRLTVQDAEAIADLPTVKMVSPDIDGRAQAVYGSKNWNTRIEGVGVNYEGMRAATPVMGRFFNEEEYRSRQKVALLGLTVSRELFGENSPVGGEIKINRINFKVIGVLPEKGSGGWRDQDDVIIVPLTTAMYRVLGEEYLHSIDVEVRGPEFMETAQEEIRTLMAKRKRLTGETKDIVDIRNMAEIQETLAATTKTMSWLLGSIAIISLLVGGIGIMNIMLVSVTERTREIGLRKAIGARAQDIMTQFLIEAIVLTLTGGVMGIVLGAGAAMILSAAAGWTTKVSLSSVLLATLFSGGVGMAFGLWPAKQASLLNPIEALRYE
jgi:macrolide transport system ATP-binding/permease protein